MVPFSFPRLFTPVPAALEIHQALVEVHERYQMLFDLEWERAHLKRN